MTSSKSSTSVPPQLPPLPFIIPRIKIHEPDAEVERVLAPAAVAAAEDEAESKPDQNKIGSSYTLSADHRRSRLSWLPVPAVFSRHDKKSKYPEDSQNLVPRKPAPAPYPGYPALSTPLPPTRPAPAQPQAQEMPHTLRPIPNQYGRVPGTSEPVFAVRQTPPRSIPLQTNPPHLLANPQRPTNAGPSHQRNASYSIQASQQYGRSSPPNETAWRTSHPVSTSIASKPAQIPGSVSNQPQQAQRLVPEHYPDSPLPAQRLTVKAAPSPRSVSQPNTRSNHLHKPSAELLKPRHPSSPDTSPRESPYDSPVVESRGRSISLIPNFVELGGAPAVAQSPGLNSPASPSYSDGGSQGLDFASRKRKSWMPGSRSRNASQDISGAANGLGVWYYGEPNREYNVRLLENAQRVSFPDL
jgi:hypothetical protein